jgi:hypothetical protein
MRFRLVKVLHVTGGISAPSSRRGGETGILQT